MARASIDSRASTDSRTDVGPGAGEAGGEIIYSGKPDGIEKIKNSYTGKYISREMEIAVPKKRTKIQKAQFIILGALSNIKFAVQL